MLEPSARLHGARGLQVVLRAPHRGPARLHLAAARVHVVPGRAVDEDPAGRRRARSRDPVPVVFMLEPSCGLHLATRRIHVIPSAIHESPVNGRRARSRDPVPVVALLKPSFPLHGTPGMQIVLVIPNRLPAGLHDASRWVKIIPGTSNELPSLGKAPVELLVLPCPIGLLLPCSL